MNTFFSVGSAACISAVMAISPTHTLETKELPKVIIADGQWIIADMDGTLIETPGYQREPTLNESVAKDAIVNWLRAGGNLLLITGCETQRTHERFSNCIPQDLEKALIEKRLLVGTNGGAIISYFDGNRWTEDANYSTSATETEIAIPIEAEDVLMQNAVLVVNEFYQKLRNDPDYLPDDLKNKYSAILEIARSKHPYDFTLEELDTLNSDIVPRIEIRRTESNRVVQVCIIGIPSQINYDLSKLNLDSLGNFHLIGVGLTHEINIKGVDKALPIRWLQKGQLGYPELNSNKSVAIGDRPNHNDAPLTKAVGNFVSVCEFNTPNYLPQHVTLHIGHNEAGSRQLLERLLGKAEEFTQSNRLEPVIINTIDETVKDSIEFLSH